MRPQAREDALIVQEISDELVVYDQARQRGHRLNRTAAFIWQHCDGQTTVVDLAKLIQSELQLPADEELVWLALDRLGKAHLLRERPLRSKNTAVSRREVVQKLGRVGGFALLLPMVATLAVPIVSVAHERFCCQCNFSQHNSFDCTSNVTSCEECFNFCCKRAKGRTGRAELKGGICQKPRVARCSGNWIMGCGGFN